MRAWTGAAVAVVVCCAGSAGAEVGRRFEAKDVFALEWAAEPQVSPDGGRIVYVRTSYDKLLDRARGALWMLATDGSSHRPLVTGGDVSAPRWSPDGKRIAYRSSGAKGAELRIRYLDDGSDFAVAQLLEAPGPFAWSPNGSWLAFSMFVAGETPSFATPPPAPKQLGVGRALPDLRRPRTSASTAAAGCARERRTSSWFPRRAASRGS